MEIDALIGISVLSIILTLLAIIPLIFRLRHAPLKPSSTYYILVIQLAYVIADVFRLSRAVWMKMNTFNYQLSTDLVQIVHSQYISFAIEATCLTAMVLLTTLRFHIFSVVVTVYIVLAVLVTVAAFIAFVLLISLWAAAALHSIPIFQNAREGHLLIACSLFMLILAGLMLIASSVAVFLTSRKAYRHSKRKRSKIGEKHSMNPRGRENAPEAYKIMTFLGLGIFFSILSAIILLTSSSEVSVGIYALFIRISQIVAVVYIAILGKQWADWMEALGQEKNEKEPLKKSDVDWTVLAWDE